MGRHVTCGRRYFAPLKRSDRRLPGEIVLQLDWARRPSLSSQALHIADDAAMDGSKAARKYIERRAMHFAARSVMLTEVDSGPPRSRQEQTDVCAMRGDEHRIPRLVKGSNLFGTHAQHFCTVSRGWRGASQSHTGHSARDDLRNGQAKLDRLSGEPGGTTTATMRHEIVSAVARG